MLGFNGMILTTVGARSGAERTSPVGWWPGPDGSWLIVAAANGATRNPAWYHNIAAHPTRCRSRSTRDTRPGRPRRARAAARVRAAPACAEGRGSSHRLLGVTGAGLRARLKASTQSMVARLSADLSTELVAEITITPPAPRSLKARRTRRKAIESRAVTAPLST
jgi:deazaflavin-dependent oxidoreductase (nitroreductase family)